MASVKRKRRRSEVEEKISNVECDQEKSKEVDTSHQLQLDALKKTDPDFFAFLRDNDPELLEFNEADSCTEDLSNETIAVESQEDVKVVSFDPEKLDELMVIPTPKKSIPILLSLFHSIVLSNYSDGIEKLKRLVKPEIVERYLTTQKFPSLGKKLSNDVVNFCIKVFPKNQQKKISNKGNIRSLYQNFFIDLVLLLCSVSSSEIAMLQVLKCIQSCSRLLQSFIVAFYATINLATQLLENPKEDIRISSFCAIKKLCMPSRYVDVVEKVLNYFLKKSILNKYAGVDSSHWIFIKVSLIELMSLQKNMLYKFLFKISKDACKILRDSISTKGKESVKLVTSWKYVHILDLLVYGIKSDENSRRLIHPVSEMLLASFRHIDSQKYFPFRYHVLRFLVDLQEGCSIYVPLVPNFIQMFKSNGILKAGVRASGVLKLPELNKCLKYSKECVNIADVKKSSFDAVIKLYLRYLVIVSRSAAFPEFCFFCLKWTRGLYQEAELKWVIAVLKSVLSKVEACCEIIKNKRLNDFENANFLINLAEAEKINKQPFIDDSENPMAKLQNDVANYGLEVLFQVNTKETMKPNKSKKKLEKGEKRNLVRYKCKDELVDLELSD